jgi:hypothetical protein
LKEEVQKIFFKEELRRDKSPIFDFREGDEDSYFDDYSDNYFDHYSSNHSHSSRHFFDDFWEDEI